MKDPRGPGCLDGIKKQFPRPGTELSKYQLRGAGDTVRSDDHNPANKHTHDSQTLPAVRPSLFLGASPLTGRARTQGCERPASRPLTGLHVHLSALTPLPVTRSFLLIPGSSTTRSRATLMRYVDQPGSGGAESNPRVQGEGGHRPPSAPPPHPLG